MQALTILMAACAAVVTFAGPLEESLPSRSLFQFEDAASVESWRPNHDVVMGGVSSGRASWTGEGVRFAGELSLENNGGFASFRTQLAEPLDLSGCGGLRLRVRGDGRNWKVSLRTGQGRSDHNWQAPFQTSGGDEWQTVTVPFDVFVPVFHGRYSPTAEPLNLANIRNLGLQVADGQAGEYSLEVSSIDAWKVGAEPALPGTVRASHARSEALARALDQKAPAETLLELLRNSERVLVVAEPLTGNDYGKSASIQLGRFVSVLEDLADRDLRLVHLAGDRASLVAGRQLGAEATKALRSHWELPVPQWSCVLIGKDGGIKKRWSEPFEPREAFEAIDAMPMRRSEVRER